MQATNLYERCMWGFIIWLVSKHVALVHLPNPLPPFAHTISPKRRVYSEGSPLTRRSSPSPSSHLQPSNQISVLFIQKIVRRDVDNTYHSTTHLSERNAEEGQDSTCDIPHHRSHREGVDCGHYLFHTFCIHPLLVFRRALAELAESARARFSCCVS